MTALALLLLVLASGSGGEGEGSCSTAHTLRDLGQQPARDSHGRIARSRQVVAEFRAANPCPLTGKTTGACHGWDISHGCPLFCGAPCADEVANLAWLPHAAHVEFHKNLQRCSSAVGSP